MRVHHAANIGEAQPQDVLKCAPALRHGDCRLGGAGPVGGAGLPRPAPPPAQAPAAVHGAPARGQRMPPSRGRSDRRSPRLPAFFAAERAAPAAAPG